MRGAWGSRGPWGLPDSQACARSSASPFSLLSSDWRTRGRRKLGKHPEIFEPEMMYPANICDACHMRNSLPDSKRSQWGLSAKRAGGNRSPPRSKAKVPAAGRSPGRPRAVLAAADALGPQRPSGPSVLLRLEHPLYHLRGSTLLCSLPGRLSQWLSRHLPPCSAPVSEPWRSCWAALASVSLVFVTPATSRSPLQSTSLRRHLTHSFGCPRIGSVSNWK